jgi:uncharacterized protein (TIGR03435 family)
VTIEYLIAWISPSIGSPVIDSTALAGKYSFTLDWEPEVLAKSAPSEKTLPSGIMGPSIFTALKEQLGLELIPNKKPIPVLIIDHLEEPSEN